MRILIFYYLLSLCHYSVSENQQYEVEGNEPKEASLFYDTLKVQDSFVFIKETKNPDIIDWSENHKLTWDNFKSEPDSSLYEDYMAITFSRVDIERLFFDDSIVYMVTAQFSALKSWTRIKADELLRHEQLHFDITELIARKLRQAYLMHISTDLNLTTQKFNQQYIEIARNERRKYNQIYDDETGHGTIVDRQQLWQEKVDKELNELDNFSGNRVVIKRK